VVDQIASRAGFSGCLASLDFVFDFGSDAGLCDEITVLDDAKVGEHRWVRRALEITEYLLDVTVFDGR
jgi:hypothetical protein